MHGPGIQFAVLLNAVIFLVAILAYGYWRLSRRKRSRSAGGSAPEWYETTASLCREVRAIAAEETQRSRDDLQRELLPLASRLKGHARAAPAEVNDELVRDLFDLATDCYALSMEHTRLDAARSGDFLEDEVEKLEAQAAAVEQQARNGKNEAV